jgi:hypothetical protein
MNILLEIQKIEDLVIDCTVPPFTPVLRQKLHLVADQFEAELKAHARLKAAHLKLHKAQVKIVKANAKLVAENKQLKKAVAQKQLKPFQPPKGGMISGWSNEPPSEV